MILRTILALLFGFSLAMAQNQTLSTPRPSTLVPPVRPFRLPPRTGIETQMEISLDQTLAMALANNKDIESSRIDREESDYVLTAAQGAYDPTLNVTSYWEQQITPIASSLGGSSTGSVINKTWQADPGVTQPLPWYGGTFKTDLSSADAYSNNSFLSLNPQYETSLNFSYTQPLWRNLLYDSNRHQIDVAKKNRSLTDQQFRQRVMAVVLQAEQAYWELSYAYNNLQVQLDAVRIGIQQDESNRRQEEQGLLAPIDVVAAQTQLATFEVGAYAAQSGLTAAENALKELVLPDRSDTTWSSAMIPTTPEDVKAPLTPLADAIAEAVANRPEIAEVKINGEINEKDVRYYREQTKPQVNLTALYTRTGLAGVVLPPGPYPFTGAVMYVNPDYATEVTLQPLDRYPLDAAILFSDILTVPDAMGLGLDFVAGEGPRFMHPVRGWVAIEVRKPGKVTEAFFSGYPADGQSLPPPGTLLTAIPTVLVFQLLQRYIVDGLTAGAVKG